MNQIVPASTQQIITYDYSQKMTVLTPEEKEHYLTLSSKIEVGNMGSITQYGAELSNIIASNGNTLLDSVRGNSTNEVVELTNDLLAKMKMIDVDNLDDTSFKNKLRRLPIIKHFMQKIDTILIKYDTVKNNIDEISKSISQKSLLAQRDNNTLDTVYNNNKNYLSQLRELIIAAKLKEQEINQRINEMSADPINYDAYQVNDMKIFQNALQKRIADMIITENVLHQNLFQISAIQGNNTAIINKSDNIVTHVIPIWRDQITIAIMMDNQKASIEAQKKITDATNQILLKNAQNLKINSINVAKATEETVISIETLRSTYDSLIETVNEVNRIHSEGHKNREVVEQTLLNLRDQFETKMIANNN